jgi:hypothetical protein
VRSFLSCAVKHAVTTTTPSMTVDGEELYFLILILASLGVHLMLAPWTAFLIRLFDPSADSAFTPPASFSGCLR